MAIRHHILLIHNETSARVTAFAALSTDLYNRVANIFDCGFEGTGPCVPAVFWWWRL